jgi:hypothetical protein
MEAILFRSTGGSAYKVQTTGYICLVKILRSVATNRMALPVLAGPSASLRLGIFTSKIIVDPIERIVERSFGDGAECVRPSASYTQRTSDDVWCLLYLHQWVFESKMKTMRINRSF